jgi:hypothetical protein
VRLLAHLFGVDGPNGPGYLFWSGPGADLGELAIVGALWHHLNCHEARCWRLARHQMGGRCRRHARKGD